MKQVFENGMVAHIWAQRQQPEARSHNGNFSFSGDALYSYSTVIGRFIDTPRGTATLVTSRTYSKTTSSKHMPALHRAIGYGGALVFHVPHVSPVLIGGREHTENLAHLAGQYDETAAKARRARTLYGDLQGTLASYDERAAAYADCFELAYTRRNPEADTAAILAHRAQAEAKRNTPAAIAKREKAAAAREAKAQRMAALERATNAEKLEAWREGLNPFIPHGARIDENGGAYLRVRGNMLETSQGANVPLEHAIRVFRFVKLCRERGEAWQRNGRTLRVGHFQVDSVDEHGNFRAGCHRINWPEVERAAAQAGVIDQPAADTRDVPAAA